MGRLEVPEIYEWITSMRFQSFRSTKGLVGKGYLPVLARCPSNVLFQSTGLANQLTRNLLQPHRIVQFLGNAAKDSVSQRER